MRSVYDNAVLIAHNASETSKAAAAKMLPKSGSMRRLIYNTIDTFGGLADFELENILKGKHQSISAGRRSLVIDGFILDSGYTRINESGNACTVWKIAPMKQGELF
jgi:hypothetical protein